MVADSVVDEDSLVVLLVSEEASVELLSFVLRLLMSSISTLVSFIILSASFSELSFDRARGSSLSALSTAILSESSFSATSEAGVVSGLLVVVCAGVDKGKTFAGWL